MTKKTRQQINKEYYEKNKEKVKELVERNRLKKKDSEINTLNFLRENAISRGESHFGYHIQHLRMTEKDGKYVCECGGEFRKGDQARHSKTKKHHSYFCKILKEETLKEKQGLPNRLFEIFMERNHCIIKRVF